MQFLLAIFNKHIMILVVAESLLCESETKHEYSLWPVYLAKLCVCGIYNVLLIRDSEIIKMRQMRVRIFRSTW